ncbi:MAG: hypothetical protein HKN44_16020 [Ilumatobacter sp.]|nr:hypothetical protein [Ilumatobacter sp.]
MSHAAADHYRRRARRLRSLALRIEHSFAMQLDSFAGDDTWRGRRPGLCRTTLRSNQRQLHHAADQLRWQAFLFDRRADQLDAAAALAARF